MDIFAGKKRLISYLSGAFMLVAFAELVAWILSVLPLGFDGFDRVEGFIFCVAFGGFASLYVSSSAKKALATSLALTLSSAIFSTFSGFGYSIIFCVVLGLCFAIAIDRMSLVYGTLSVIMLGAVLGVLLGVLYQPLFEVQKSICSFLSGKGAIFGVFNDVYSVFASDSLSSLFYGSDYSTAQLIDGKIVSGIINVFSSGESSSLVARYLTGKYFVNIFVSTGAFVVLFLKLSDNERLPLIFVLLLSIVAGDSRLMSAMILIYNPFVYLGYLFCVLVSYFVSRFVDIRIGFVDSASILELFKYCHSWIYFVLIGVIISVLTYFVIQIILSRFDFDKRKILPKNAKRIVTALGGDSNIERIRNGRVLVNNPNLIDVLRLDCEIHGNEITLIQNDLDVLQEYY